VPPYPAVEEDLAVVVANEVPSARVRDLILASNLVRDASVFDVYQGDPVPRGKKSLAFAISYQAQRTLTDEDVAKERRRIVERLQRELDAELRA
jgi:phenylalanyl-tRNA synthetase beta chain